MLPILMRRYLSIVALVLAVLPASGQSIQVSISGVPPILPSPYVDDLNFNYESGLYPTQVTVSGAEPIRAALRFTLSREGRELVSVTSDEVTYEPGVTAYRTFQDPPRLRFGVDQADLVDRMPTSERNALIQSGALPEGMYTLDIEPIPAGMEVAIPGSVVFEVRLPDPPVPIAPVRAEEVSVQPLLLWTPVVGAGAESFTYRVRLVEVLPGQSPSEAIASNRPLVDADAGAQTTFSYTPDLLPLEPETTYAWVVVAASASARMPLRNGGASDVETFRFVSLTPEPPPLEFSPALQVNLDSDLPPPLDPSHWLLDPVLPTERVSGVVEWLLPDGRRGPLPEAVVSVSGLVDQGRSRLATGVTDASGRFDIELTDPQTAGLALFGDVPGYLRAEARLPGAGGLVQIEPAILSLGGSQNVLTARLRTLRVEVSATDEQTGHSIPNVSVTPMRTEGHLERMGFLGAEGGGTRRHETPDGRLSLRASGPTGQESTGPLVATPRALAPLWVLIEAPGYYELLAEVSAGPDVVSLPVRLVPRGHAVSGRTVSHQDGTPIADLRVVVRADGRRLETRSDAEGRFTLEGIPTPSGETRLLVFEGTRQVYAETITLSADPVVRDPLRILTAPVTLTGIITDEQDRPLGGANLVVEGDAQATTVSENDGAFTLSLWPGSYEITGFKNGFAAGRRSVVVHFDGSSEVIGQADRNTDTEDFTSLDYYPEGGPLERTGGPARSPSRNTQIQLQGSTTTIVVTTRMRGGAPAPFRSVSVGSTAVTTDADGLAQVTVRPGIHRVQGRSSGSYIPATPYGVVASFPAGRTHQVSISFVAEGAELAGKAVGQDGLPLAGVEVVVTAGDVTLRTTTGSTGEFSLAGTPTGSLDVTFTKAPHASVTTSVLVRDLDVMLRRTVRVDAVLGPPPAGRPTVSTLMGFRVDVSEMTPQSRDNTVWEISGRLIDLPSGPFALSPGTELTFSKVRVRLEGTDARPVDPRGTQHEVTAVQLGQTQVVVTYGGRRILLSSATGLLLVTSDGGARSVLAGNLDVDLGSAFPQRTGWNWTSGSGRVAADAPGLRAPTGTLPMGIRRAVRSTVMASDGRMPAFDGLILGSDIGLQLAGFPFAPTSTTLRTDGLHLTGTLRVAGFPGGVDLPVSGLVISGAGQLGNAQFDLARGAGGRIGGWSFTFSRGTLSDGGVILAGFADLVQRGVPRLSLSFSTLRVTNSEVFGGDFLLPTNGATLLGSLALKQGSGGSYGLTRDGSVYELAGDALLTPSKYFQRSLEIRTLSLRSDGAVTMSAQPGFTVGFSNVAQYTLSGLTYGTVAGDRRTGLRVDGSLDIDIPLLKAEMGAVTFLEGGSISVEDIAYEFDLESMGKVKVRLAFVDGAPSIPAACGTVADTPLPVTGFCGTGSFALAKLREFDASVHVLRGGNGRMVFGGSAAVGIAAIPITPSLMFSKPGAGFSYNTGGGFAVFIQGDVTFGPPESGTGMQPVQLTVRNGPVFEGSGTLTVTESEFGQVSVVLDTAQKLFTVNGTVARDLMSGVELTGDVGLVIGGNNGGFFFFGAMVTANLQGLLTGNASLVTGYNFAYADFPSFASYVDVVPAAYKSGGRISGIHIAGYTLIGSREERCAGAAGIAWLCAYAYNEGTLRLNKSFSSSRFDIGLGSGWGAGGNAGALIFKVSAAMSFNGELSGSYDNTSGWTLAGTASGQASASAGWCGSGCGNGLCTKKVWFIRIPVGFRVCVGCSASFTYVQRPRRLDFSIGW